MNWIKMRSDIYHEPEVVAIARRLGVTRHHAVGVLHRFWAAADAHAVEIVASNEVINASGICPEFVRQMSGKCPESERQTYGFLAQFRTEDVDSAADQVGFSDAICAVGWLFIRPDGAYIPGWNVHHSTSAKIRSCEAKRKAAERRKSKAEKIGNTSRPESVRKMSGKSRTKTGPEKRREEKENTPYGRIPSAPRPRPRNELYDAVAEVTGLDPTTDAGPAIGRAAAALARADPPYTPDDVRAFGAQYPVFCPWGPDSGRSRPTPGELSKWIGKLRSVDPGANAGNQRKRPKTQADIRRERLHEQIDTIFGREAGDPRGDRPALTDAPGIPPDRGE